MWRKLGGWRRLGERKGCGMANERGHTEAVLEAVLDESFIRLTAGGRRKGQTGEWTRVVVRPVGLRAGRRLQFSYTDGERHVARNHAVADAVGPIEALLASPFSNIHVQTGAGDLHIRVTKRGRVLVTRGKPSRPGGRPALAHDRTKARALDPKSSADFLQQVGVADAEGKVRPGMRAKYRQINAFVAILQQTLGDDPPQTLHVVDCGCGSAYLTFAAYHYLNVVRGVTATFHGVDLNEGLIAKVQALPQALGWERIAFHAARIAEFEPAEKPDLVLSLHACDTATDDALARGVAWGSRWILSAPCCQHELHKQLQAPLYRPVLRHGILRERMADILTDAFRASILRILGYRTQVIEFVSPEHTAKNLMIVAERALPAGDPQFVGEYEALKAHWQVTPILEKLLEPELAPYLRRR